MQAAETQSQGSAVYDRWAPGLECRQHVKGATGRHLGGSSRERGREREPSSQAQSTASSNSQAWGGHCGLSGPLQLHA